MPLIPKVSIPPADNVDDLRRNIEMSVNRIVDQVNADKVTSDVSMNGFRITNLRKGVSANDAVTLKQLKEEAIPRRRGQYFPATNITQGAGGKLHVIFELVEAISVADDVAPHVELCLDAGELAAPHAAFITAKTEGVGDCTVSIEYSTDAGVLPASKTWGVLVGTLTLPGGYDQKYGPLTTFNNRGPFPTGTVFRINVEAVGGTAPDDVVVTVVMDII